MIDIERFSASEGDVLPDRQLYDMEADPWEQTNLASEHPDVVSELENKTAIWAENHVGFQGDALRAVAHDGPVDYEIQKHNWEGIE